MIILVKIQVVLVSSGYGYRRMLRLKGLVNFCKTFFCGHSIYRGCTLWLL